MTAATFFKLRHFVLCVTVNMCAKFCYAMINMLSTADQTKRKFVEKMVLALLYLISEKTWQIFQNE
jgi:hypothetical protein